MILYETDRIVVREWEATDKDINDLYEIGSDVITNKYLTYPLYASKNDAVERIDYCIRTYINGYQNNDVDYAIELKGSHKVIGSIAIMGYQSICGGIVELGYQLGSNYFGQGYMTEVVKGIIKYIFDNNLALRIQAKHDENNIGSGKVMKKSGMSYEGTLRMCYRNNNSDRCNVCVYSILKEEYVID